MTTATERYNLLCQAIAAIEQGAQSYSMGTYSVTKASLATLYAERRQLAQEVAAEQNSGGFLAVDFYQ